MFKIATSIVFAALIFLPVPAEAARHSIKVSNITGEKVISVNVIGRNNGEIVGFTPTEAREFNLTVDLPENAVCNPIIRFRLQSARNFEGRVNLCGGYELEIAFPWSRR